MAAGRSCLTCTHLHRWTGPNGVEIPLCARRPPKVIAQWFLVTDENGKERAELAQAHLYPQPNPDFGCEHHAVKLASAAELGATLPRRS